MPILSREKPIASEAGREIAKKARAEVVAALAPDKLDSLGGGFLGSYRELVKSKKHLETGERNNVDRFIDSFRKHDKKLIEEKLKDPLVAELTDHIKQITDLLTTGDKAKVEDAKSLAQEDRLVAGSLGLNKDPDIKKQIEAQFVLIETYAKAQSPLRRKLLKLGTAGIGLAAIGGSGALIGAGWQAMTDAGKEKVIAPGSLPRPKAASVPSPPPLPSPASSPTPEPLAKLEAPPNPTPIDITLSPSPVKTEIIAQEKVNLDQNSEPTTDSIPPKEERIFYPEELSYEEVLPWVGKLRSTHDAVLTESLFTKELASLSNEQRAKVLDAIARAHAEGLYEYYGNTEAIIGLDPGHGGSDVGSSATASDGKTLAEKNLTWEIANNVAEKLYELSKGKYRVVILRPQNPKDEDLDRDGSVAAVERIQKRKALLLKMEEKLRPNPQGRGNNIVYCSIHLNGSPNGNEQGTEVYSPNEKAMQSASYRESSQRLATILQDKIVTTIRETGYKTVNRGAKIDPDLRDPGPNSDTQIGPYVALDSPKLDRKLA